MSANRLLLLILSAIVLPFESTPAKVSATTFQELATGSSLIVLGSVREVRQIAGVRVAFFSIEETWKGSKVREVAFLAQSTWTCDITWAEPGERLLLFLVNYEFDPDPKPPDPEVWSSQFKEPVGFHEGVDALALELSFMAVYWSGRGEMPVRVVDGTEYVTVWVDDVKLPKRVSTIDGPEPEYADFIRSIRLGDARRWLENGAAAINRTDGPTLVVC